MKLTIHLRSKIIVPWDRLHHQLEGLIDDLHKLSRVYSFLTIPNSVALEHPERLVRLVKLIAYASSGRGWSDRGDLPNVCHN